MKFKLSSCSLLLTLHRDEREAAGDTHPRNVSQDRENDLCASVDFPPHSPLFSPKGDFRGSQVRGAASLPSSHAPVFPLTRPLGRHLLRLRHLLVSPPIICSRLSSHSLPHSYPLSNGPCFRLTGLDMKLRINHPMSSRPCCRLPACRFDWKSQAWCTCPVTVSGEQEVKGMGKETGAHLMSPFLSGRH